ncbi:MAG: CoA-binding protein [Planctomycetaceae bacterium]|nr:CoA-binding protein [Planctomycetaceae bacterium]
MSINQSSSKVTTTRQPTVAILGASTDRRKFGNKSVRAHAACGYEVFPVNPKGEPIEGLITYVSLAAMERQELDRISLYLPPQIGLGLLDAMLDKGHPEVWLNPGSESPELIRRGRELGLEIIVGCSIVDLGVSPVQFP